MRSMTLYLNQFPAGGGVAVLEAMAAGCVPVVADMESGVSEVVNDDVNGFRAPVGEAGAFSEYLKRIYEEPGLFERLSANAEKTVSEGGFTIKDMTSEYVKLFEQLMCDEENTNRDAGNDILPPPTISRRWTYLPSPIHTLVDKIFR